MCALSSAVTSETKIIKFYFQNLLYVCCHCHNVTTIINFTICGDNKINLLVY